jgi:hypothetical protein
VNRQTSFEAKLPSKRKLPMLVVSPHLISRAVFKSHIQELHHTHTRSLVLEFLIDDKNFEVSYVNHSLVKHVLEAGSACA